MTALLTAAITVVLGFVVFVFGQIAQRFFIEPIQEQKRVIGEIAYVVLYYGNVGSFARHQSSGRRLWKPYASCPESYAPPCGRYHGTNYSSASA